VGIIQRQTISGSVFTYMGVVVGFITTALIFPKFLTTEQIGLLGIFLSYSYIFAQIATLGTGRVTIYFFPFFRDRAKHHHGFFYLMGMVSLAGLVLVLAVFFLMRPWLVENENESSRLLADNVNYLAPLIIATLAFLVFDSFYKNLFNAVQGIILKEFIQRLLILLFVLLYVVQWITFEQYVPLYVLAVAIPAIVLLINLIRHKEFSFRPYSSDMAREHRNKMLTIGLYGILIGFSGMVILNIDRIMVERMMGLGPTGVYTTMAFFATLIVIPSRALLKISDPIIAQLWKNEDMKGLQDNYFKSSLNQTIAGALLLVGIWGNIGNIIRILPPDYAGGNYVVLFIGLAFLTDMATGTATYILANSKYFKYQTYFIALLVVFIVITNYLLIPIWGITGAAAATFISKLLNNLMRHQMLYNKFRLQPYNRKYIFIVAISVVSYLAGYIIPEISNLYLDIILRSAVIGGIFIILIIAFRISDEVNDKWIWLRSRLLK
jgi:O-antigen/teichoic acid export membrane protein